MHLLVFTFRQRQARFCHTKLACFALGPMQVIRCMSWWALAPCSAFRALLCSLRALLCSLQCSMHARCTMHTQMPCAEGVSVLFSQCHFCRITQGGLLPIQDKCVVLLCKGPQGIFVRLGDGLCCFVPSACTIACTWCGLKAFRCACCPSCAVLLALLASGT